VKAENKQQKWHLVKVFRSFLFSLRKRKLISLVSKATKEKEIAKSNLKLFTFIAAFFPFVLQLCNWES
jgi:hypothetical protein